MFLEQGGSPKWTVRMLCRRLVLLSLLPSGNYHITLVICEAENLINYAGRNPKTHEVERTHAQGRLR